MKIQNFKKIIKEAVREVLLEEIDTLNELYRQKDHKNLEPPTPLQNSSPGNTIAEMIDMTRKSMTREDFKSLVGESIQPGKPELNFTTSNLYPSTSPQIGVDISQLGFVKNAASIYNKAVEKDKVRFGQ